MAADTRAHVGWIARLIAASAAQPTLVLLLTALLALGGWTSLQRIPLDALPDLSDPQVIVLTEWPGRSPDLVEDQVTYPLSSALQSTPGAVSVRGQSFFGLSFVYVIFEEETELYWARSRVQEALSRVQAQLPEDARPQLGPDGTGVGWVLMYALSDESGQQDLQQLRALQDWQLRFALESVPGVAEVAPLGGFVKQYSVLVDPDRLLAQGLSLQELIDAIQAAGSDAGGGVIELAGHEHMIRGRASLQSLEDLRSVPLRVGAGGVALRLGDVAELSLSPAPRRGIAEWNGLGEAVGGIVVMRQGQDARAVIQSVHERLDEIRQGLPEGVEVHIAYDRSELIDAAIGTLQRTLAEELAVVALVLWVFLLSPRSALIPALVLPLALLISFLPLRAQGLSANLMSIGGIAVAIGAMVDAAIVLIENLAVRLSQAQEGEDPRARRARAVRALQEVGPSIFFSLLVMTLSFLPVFTLQGAEGRLFRPLAWTKTWAMAAAALLAVTLLPALAMLLLGRWRPSAEDPLTRRARLLYAPVVRWVLRYPWRVIGLALGLLLLTLPAAKSLKSEFMPPLQEGTLLYMPTAPPGMSMTQASAVLQAMDEALMQVPEVETVLGKMGRAETATDPAPLGMAETTIQLKPRDQWREGLSWEDLIQELDEALQVPGMPNLWWMPIQTRLEMLSTGVRSPVAVQILGEDLRVIEEVARSIEALLKDLPGTRSAFAEQSTGGFYLDLTIRRDDAARYGLSARSIHQTLQAAVGGVTVTETLEGRRRFPVRLRYARELRDDLEALRRVLVATPSGAQIPLTQVADLDFVSGPPVLRSEDGQLVGHVFLDPGESPLGDYAERARERVERELELPPGIRLEWTGQVEALQRAEQRLWELLPLTLLGIVVLLYLNTRSLIETGIILLAIPFSLIGAVWMLWLLDYQLSVAVWVGLIALAGLDAEMGVVMLLYLKLARQRAAEAGELRDRGQLREAIVQGAAGRLRPKLMTVTTSALALAPVLWSTGTGSEVMKRIAAPMVGGLGSSFFLELTVYPALYLLWKGSSLPPEASAELAEVGPER